MSRRRALARERELGALPRAGCRECDLDDRGGAELGQSALSPIRTHCCLGLTVSEDAATALPEPHHHAEDRA